MVCELWQLASRNGPDTPRRLTAWPAVHGLLCWTAAS